jgi:DNA-directed RNA polymerase specialized sigma24 family protein
MKRVAKSAAVVAALAPQSFDRAFIEFITDGGGAALKLLYLRHCVWMSRLVSRLSESISASEETVNEVFLELWRDAERLEVEAHVAVWLPRIVRTEALSQCGRRLELPISRHVRDLTEVPSDSHVAVNEEYPRLGTLQKCMTVLTPIHLEVIKMIPRHGRRVERSGSHYGNWFLLSGRANTPPDSPWLGCSPQRGSLARTALSHQKR